MGDYRELYQASIKDPAVLGAGRRRGDVDPPARKVLDDTNPPFYRCFRTVS